MNVLLVTASVILFALSVFIGRLISDSLLHPIRVQALVWGVIILFALLFWDVDYHWDGAGLFWLFGAVIATELGALAMKGLIRRTNGAPGGSGRPAPVNTLQPGEPLLWKWLKILIAVAAISALLNMYNSGFRLRDLMSVEGWLRVNALAAAQRYSAGRKVGMSLFLRVLNAFTQIGCICGGYAFNYTATRRQKLLCIMSLLPTVFSMMYTNAKAGFIGSSILWFSGWAVSTIEIRGRLPRVGVKRLVKLGALVAGGLLVLFFVMLVRNGRFDASARAIIFRKFMLYGFGEIVNFDAWFAREASAMPYAMGFNTYMAPFQALGLTQRMAGVYGSITGYGNVYTAYRGVIMDFGTVLGLVYCVFRGMVAQGAYEIVCRTPRRHTVAKMLLPCQYMWALYGLIISPWIYAVSVMAIIGFGGFLMVVRRQVVLKGAELTPGRGT